MKKTFRVIEKPELNITYKAKVNGKNIVFKRTKHDTWAENTRNTIIATLIDDDMEITIKIKETELKLAYHEMVELLLLLKIKMKNDGNMPKYEII